MAPAPATERFEGRTLEVPGTEPAEEPLPDAPSGPEVPDSPPVEPEPAPVGPGVPEPSPPVEPEPLQPEVPATDPRGPETLARRSARGR